MASFAPSRLALAALLACALGGLTVSARAQDAFYTVGTYTIDAAHSVGNNAHVGLDSSFSPTDAMNNPYNPTVNLVTGGSVGGYLEAVNSSTVTISGGSVGSDLYAYDRSAVTISGGSIGSILYAYDRSAVTISGGSIGVALEAYDRSTITISGGSIGSILYAYDRSAVTISGGSVSGYLRASGSSTVKVSGGTFGQYLGINFFDRTTGSFILVGSNLTATNIGTDPNFGGIDYSLSGTLQSGTDLRGYILNVQPGSTFLLQTAPSAVPAPGSLAVLLGTSAASSGLLGWGRRGRKEQRA